MKKASKVLLIISIIAFALCVAIGLFSALATFGESAVGYDGTAASIMSLVYTAFCAVPLVISIVALKKLSKAENKKELTAISILTLIFGNPIAGILMLVMKDEDLKV